MGMCPLSQFERFFWEKKKFCIPSRRPPWSLVRGGQLLLAEECCFEDISLFSNQWKNLAICHDADCTATAIPFIYSFSENSTASAQFPHSCVCERFIYSQDRSTYIFPPAEKAGPSWEYIIRSQTHECGNWGWGPDIPFLGIFVSNFRHFVFAVWLQIREQRPRHCLVLRTEDLLYLLFLIEMFQLHFQLPNKVYNSICYMPDITSQNRF